MASVSSYRPRIAAPLTFTPDFPAAAVAIVSVALSVTGAALVNQVLELGESGFVLAVVLALTLGRAAQRQQPQERLLALLLLPCVAIVAGRVGGLMIHEPIVGDAFFTLAVSGAIWIRRFGSRMTRIGAIASLPFVAMMVAPSPVRSHGETDWTATALVGLIAFLSVNLVTLVAERTGFRVPGLRREQEHDAAPRRRNSTARYLPSTRMAIQMAVSLILAFSIGHLVFGKHWPWVVITVYIVASGNRSRGDVVYKGVQRLAGALLGTLSATLVAGTFSTGDKRAIVVLFAILTVATIMRTISYAWWAGGVTAALSLLYGYLGESGDSLLAIRLIAIATGALLSVGVAWFVLPIRTTDVLRRRIADALAALSEVLGTMRTDPSTLEESGRRFAGALAEVDRLAPPLAAHHRWQRLWQSHSPLYRPIAALRGVSVAVGTIAASDPELLAEVETTRLAGIVAANVGLLRRAIPTRTSPDFRHLPKIRRENRAPSERPVVDALVAINLALPEIAGFVAPNSAAEHTPEGA